MNDFMKKVQAIKELLKEQEGVEVPFSLNNDRLIIHQEGVAEPTQAAITAKIAEITERDYQLKRQNEYPSIPEQLDLLYWDKVNGTNIWVSTIGAVKAKYPKPNGGS
jgi:hypothetical protein